MPDKNPLPPVPPAVNGWRVPGHGHGKLRPFRPGQSGNPAGHSGRYGEVVRLCREAGPAVAKRLIEIALDPGEERRVSVVAAQEVLNRAFGRPREMPEAAAPPLDLTAVSEEKLRLIIKALEAARDAKRARDAKIGAAEGAPAIGQGAAGHLR